MFNGLTASADILFDSRRDIGTACADDCCSIISSVALSPGLFVIGVGCLSRDRDLSVTEPLFKISAELFVAMD